MKSRDNILRRIRAETRKMGDAKPGPAVEVWPTWGPSREQLVERFCRELEAVSGEPQVCDTLEQAQQRLLEMMDALNWTQIGAVDKPMCRELTAGLPAGRVAWERAGRDAEEMARLPAGLVEADALLADTGSCVMACASAEQRLLCYLPPVCLVVASAERLREHMPAAWGEIAQRARESKRRGELVVVTGPSRTADIEKRLVLGVHGPERVIVLLVQEGGV